MKNYPIWSGRSQNTAHFRVVPSRAIVYNPLARRIAAPGEGEAPTLIRALAGPGLALAVVLAAPAAGARAEAPAREVRAAWYNFYRLPPLRAQAEPLLRAHARALQSMGLNRIYVLVKTPDGLVFHDSRLVPRWSAEMTDARGRKTRVELDWDPLAALLALGDELGLEVHPYVNVFCEGGEDPEDRARNPLLGPHPEWAVTNRRGERLGWASPAIPQVVDHELGILCEIVSRYDIRGIQLDRIRYPAGAEEAGQETRTVKGRKVTLPSPVDYNPEALRRFRARAGRPAGATVEEGDPEWVRFRQDQVTEFVRAARRELLRIRPGIVLSAAVFPQPASAARQQLQDWALWGREGLVDALCTMAYETDAVAWGGLVSLEREAAGGAALIPGIGASQLARPEQLEAHVAAARRAGVPGYVLFNAFALFEKKGFHAALMGINR
jgi:uncharacterized lipoprotein YddW (UPF0748 family)